MSDSGGHRIVFLDRETIAPQIRVRRPAFAHTWEEYPRTAPDELAGRLAEGASIVIANKVALRAASLERAPGLKLIHQGQMEGWRARLPTHLVRWPDEPVDEDLQAFYEQLLTLLRRPVLREGAWARLEPMAAWAGNPSWQGFVAYAWRGADSRLIAAVNYSGAEGQCYVRLPFPELTRRRVRLRDLMSDAVYERDGATLTSQGLYLDLPPWGYNVFALETAG